MFAGLFQGLYTSEPYGGGDDDATATDVGGGGEVGGGGDVGGDGGDSEQTTREKRQKTNAHSHSPSCLV